MADRTRLVYQEEGGGLVHVAKTLSIVPVSVLSEPDKFLVKNTPGVEHAVITESTIFHAQGGGQPSEIGIIIPGGPRNINSMFAVESVRHPTQGSQILHFGRFASNSDASFKAGDNVQQFVDEEKRNLHSRLHTAGHILGLAINALSREGVLPPLTESKASHYPDSAAVEFGGLIEGKHKAAIQAKTDEFVRSAKPVKIHWWSMEDLLEKCTGVAEGFALPEGEVMGRVVEMEGLGSYPCGGTHVKDCSQVGKIEVKKISRSKGTSRVSYRVL